MSPRQHISKQNSQHDAPVKGTRAAPGRFSEESRIHDKAGKNLPVTHKFSELSVGESDPAGMKGGMPFQPKLRISSPGDKYEIEADRMAEAVMGMDRTREGNESSAKPLPGTGMVQRACNDCEEEELQRSAAGTGNENLIQRQGENEEDEEKLQLKQESSSPFPGIKKKPSGIGQLQQQGGKPLPENTRKFLEPRFGHDFSKVRIHDNHIASNTARLLNAKAFTLRNHVVFGKGYYRPESNEGRKLIAHELAHVIQQGHATRYGGSRVSSSQNLNGVIQKKNGPGKSKTTYPISLKAQKLLWDDLKAYFPGDGRKLAGSGYKASIDLLETDFTSGKTGSKSVSAPIVYVGKKYLKEQDADKRKKALKKEIEKIDSWRVKNAKVDNKDLKNADIKAKLQDMSAKKKLSYIGELKAKKFIKNDEVIAYIKKVMQSTPIVKGAKFRSQGGFEVKYDNVKIIVLPDVYNSSRVTTGAKTIIETVPENPDWYKYPGYNWDASGKIDSMTFTPTVPDIVYTIQTHYRSGSSPRSTSGYGVGTRPEDKTAEQKTLGFHEGAHGEEFIKSVKAGTSKHKYPKYTGKVGDARRPFEKAHKSFVKAQKKFKKMIDKALDDNIQVVDCSGKTIEKFHKEKGTSTTVHCH